MATECNSAQSDLQAAQRLLQGAPRTGEVEAQKARVAEGGPGRQRHACLQTGPYGIRVIEPAHIQPGQVGGLDVRHRDAWQRLGDEALDHVCLLYTSDAADD